MIRVTDIGDPLVGLSLRPEVLATIAAFRDDRPPPFDDAHPITRAAICLWAYALRREIEARLRPLA